MPNQGHCVERHGFVGEPGRKIYRADYLPEPGTDRRHGIIVCKPIWGERIRTQRILRNLCRLLAGHGYYVASCDYFGDGNSEGTTLDMSYENMVEDVAMLHNHARPEYGLTTWTLIGLRLGANCAVGALERIPGAARLILIEPVISPIDLLRNALLANLTSQMTIHKKVIRNRELLIADILNGTPVNVDGFLVGKGLWQSFEAASPIRADASFGGPVIVVSMTEKGRKPADYSRILGSFARARSESIEQEFTWAGWKSYVPNPPVFLNTTLSLVAADGTE